jgi:lysine-specific demethylase/histidyl-hydroxylase NO66
MDMILQPGDLLYMPRGTIHQGNCLEDTHSLHITVSCHQLNSYGDLLEKLLPMALKTAMEEDIEFRKGLPPDYLGNLGIAHSDQDTKPRREFLTKINSLMGKLVHYASIDGAADQMGKQFMHNALPPYLSSKESARSVASGGEKWSSSKNRVVNRVELDPDTEIRLIRANCLRLVTEPEVDVVATGSKDSDDSSEMPIRMYYCVENSREYQEVGPQFMDVDSDTAPAIEALIQKYPEYIKVEDLPMDELDGKMKVVQDLWYCAAVVL